MFLHNDEYVVGVDLGTTNTCAAIMTSTTHLPQVVSYPNNLHVFKSCVRYGTQIDVGEAAYNCLINNCPDVVKNSKRIIGRYYDDEIVQRCKAEHQCGVDIEKIDNKPVFSMSNSVTVSPSDVSAEIVKRAIEMTDEYMKKHFNDNMKCVKVAVAFPAHFNNNQRTATLLAVEKAGIPKEKLTMLNEPSAAAFYYCKSNSIDNQTILIYDLGGGTFDLSIIKVKGNDYRVIKYAGDPFLGGADFDSLLAKVIMRKYEESYGVPLINTNDQSLRRLYCVRLNEIAEQTKMLLSCWNNTDVDLSLFQVQSKARGSLDSDSEDEDCINITIEDLNVKGMMKNRHLSKAVASQKFYEFRIKLQAKCNENGIELRVADRWYPSSKTCHCCKNIRKDLKLSDRIFKCACGYIEDRDFNAALNLRDAMTYEVA